MASILTLNRFVCAVAPPCVNGDGQTICPATDALCGFEMWEDDSKAINAQPPSHPELTSWTVAQYAQIGRHRAASLLRRNACRKLQAKSNNEEKVARHFEEYVAGVKEALKELKLKEFYHGFDDRLSVMSKNQIEEEFDRGHQKDGARSKRLTSVREGVDYVDDGGGGVLHRLVERWARSVLLAARKHGPRAEAEAASADMRLVEREVVATCVAGAPLGHVNADGLCPLMLAITRGAPAILRVLLASDADFQNARNAQMFSPLLLAAERDQPETFAVLCANLHASGDLKKAARMVGNGYTCLHFCAVNGGARVLALALSYDAFRCKRVLDRRSTTEGMDAFVLARHCLGQTALHKAVRYGHHRILRILLKAGACPNKKDSSGQTPLHCATLGDHYECAVALLENGADPLATDGYGKTAEANVQRHHDPRAARLHRRYSQSAQSVLPKRGAASRALKGT